MTAVLRTRASDFTVAIMRELGRAAVNQKQRPRSSWAPSLTVQTSDGGHVFEQRWMRLWPLNECTVVVVLFKSVNTFSLRIK